MHIAIAAALLAGLAYAMSRRSRDKFKPTAWQMHQWAQELKRNNPRLQSNRVYKFN